MLDYRDNTFYIIDGYGFIFRAFYALPKLTTKQGQPIGAVYGFFKMLITLINSSKPTHMVIALDTGHRTFRNDIYDNFIEQQNIKEIFTEHKFEFDMSGIKLNDLLNFNSQELIDILKINKEKCEQLCKNFQINIENIPKLFVLFIFLGIEETISVEDCKTQYKANRQETPDELKSQFSLVHEFINASGITSKSVNNFEADDVVASLAVQASKQGKQVVIVSADKDLCQLVENGKIEVYDPSKKQHLDEEGVFTKFGVKPCQLLDYLSIVGDHADNIFGVNGIGPKGAIKLLEKYGSIDEIMKNINELDEKTKQKFIDSKDNLQLAKKLIALRTDAIQLENIDDFKLKIDNASLSQFIKKYDFQSFDSMNRNGEFKRQKQEQQTKGLF